MISKTTLLPDATNLLISLGNLTLTSVFMEKESLLEYMVHRNLSLREINVLMGSGLSPELSR